MSTPGSYSCGVSSPTHEEQPVRGPQSQCEVLIQAFLVSPVWTVSTRSNLPGRTTYLQAFHMVVSYVKLSVGDAYRQVRF
jgi:hypothetical protein